MEQDLTDITEFDNDVSILYKEAQKLQIPTKFVKVDTEIQDGEEIKTYSSLLSKIQSEISAGIPLLKLAEYPIIPSDLAMIYANTQSEFLKPGQIKKEINKFYKELDISPIRDVNELKLLQQNFISEINNLYSDEAEELDDILAIQEELNNYEPLEYSPIKLESVNLIADMIFKDSEPEIADGYEIFDLSIPTSNFPLLKWNTTVADTKALYKLYKGKTLEDRPDYNLFIEETGKDILNHYNFVVWSGEGSQRYATKESYLHGIYDLTKNLLKIKIPITDNERELVKERIEEALPLEFNKIAETQISGEFYMYDLDINDLILSHMVLNEDLLKIYLFQKEISTPFALKKHLKLYYRAATDIFEEKINSSVSFSINQYYAKGGESVNILNSDGTVETKRLSPEFPYIRVKISSADSLRKAQQFMKIFARLMNFYKENRNSIEQIYNTYIPELKDFDVSKPTVKSVRKIATDSKISRLKQEAPDVFISGYARKCLCPKQPIIIPDDEIDAWENLKFDYQGQKTKRQVFKFPPDNPKWNFVCPENDFPFPGVKVNDDLENKEKYPGLPCCFADDQLSPKSKSNYNKIYGKQKSKRTQETKEGHIVKTDKIAKPFRYGLLPGSITKLLQSYNPEFNEILRKGTIRSPNSLLHCVSMAIDDEKYNELSEKEKEEYVSEIRLNIANQSFGELMKQEMYDFTNTEIRNQLADSNLFLDPDLFYRAIEESYNVNIYVFAPSNDEINRLKTKSESEGVLKLPRFKLIYAKSPRLDRSTILIYRTLGSESDNLDYPQCELIVNKSDESKDQGLFDPDINNFLFDLYQNINRNLLWELVEDNNGEIDVLGRENLFSKINYFELFNKEPTHQYLDSYGKSRGLVLEKNDEQILIVTPPSQPENLKEIDDSMEIPRASLKTVLSILSDPVSISKDQNGRTDGLWYSVLDLVYGLYIPIIPINEDLKLVEGPGNPLGESGSNIVYRIRKLKRDVDFIFQILRFLYILSVIGKNLSVKDFFKKYVVVDQDDKDSVNIYDFLNIGRTFPKVNNVNDGILEMSKRVPSLFKNDKIYLYSKKFADGLLYILTQYVKEYINSETQIPQTINRILISQDDFISYPGIVLFLSQKDIQGWLNSLNIMTFKNLIIETELNVNNLYKHESYLYQNPDNHIYLIQNVVEGNLKKALNVGWYWENYKVNPGHKIDKYLGDLDELKYVIYEISPSKHLELSENNAGDTTEFISILRYNENNYACMLVLV